MNDNVSRSQIVRLKCLHPVAYHSLAGCEDCSWQSSWNLSDAYANGTTEDARQHHITTGHSTYVEESRHVFFKKERVG